MKTFNIKWEKKLVDLEGFDEKVRDGSVMADYISFERRCEQQKGEMVLRTVGWFWK